MEYMHFSFIKKESNFNTLSGDKQRAIETQANIAVEAHRLSKYYGKTMFDKEIRQKFFDMLCDIYANKPEKEIKKYIILDSKALYYYPLTKDRYEYYEKLAKEKAEKMDKNIQFFTKNHFSSFSK